MKLIQTLSQYSWAAVEGTLVGTILTPELTQYRNNINRLQFTYSQNVAVFFLCEYLLEIIPSTSIILTSETKFKQNY